jgi:hypothetical protein
MINYELVDDRYAHLFTVDYGTGAVRTLASLDYETV